MRKFLIILSLLVATLVTYTVVTTSIKSNLFHLMSVWGDCSLENPFPWFEATLYDFYANTIAIFLWIAYKEKAIWSKLLWLVLLVTMGSIATMVYILIQAVKLKEGQGVKELLLGNR